MRIIRVGGHDVTVACWEVRSDGAIPWAAEIDSEHEAREELRCAHRRGLTAARLYAVTEDGVRVEVSV